jgi:hypothetical protein
MMPFGLSNSPGTYQRLMQECLSDLHLHICCIFIDDFGQFTIFSIFSGSVSMPASDTMCPTYLTFGIKNKHFPGERKATEKENIFKSHGTGAMIRKRRSTSLKNFCHQHQS